MSGKWHKLGRLEFSSLKSAHITYILRKETCRPVNINGVEVPQVHVKHLSFHVDRRLVWKNDIKKNRQNLILNMPRCIPIWMVHKDSNMYTVTGD